MGLRNLSFPKATVEIPGGGTFTVRGLNPDMIVSLYARHAGQLSDLWDAAQARSKGSDITEDVQGMVAALIADAPHIMAELIAIAEGNRVTDTYVDPDTEANPLGLTNFEQEVAAARNLSLPVQIDALMKVAALTFSSDMPAPKFLAVVIKMAGATTAALAKSA